jgi:hypothetical protein
MDTATQQAQFYLLGLDINLNDLPVNLSNPLYLRTDPAHDATFGTG